MTHFATVGWQWFASIDPALPWALIPIGAWLTNWSIRKWTPEAWEWFTKLGPSGVTFSKAFQMLPSIAYGVIIASWAGHGDPKGLMKAALVSLFAPVWHEALTQFFPQYYGGSFPAAGSAPSSPTQPKPPVGPATVLLLLMLSFSMSACASSLQQTRVNRTLAPPSISQVEHCQSLDTQHRNWVAIGEVSGFLAGGSGIGMVGQVLRDKDTGADHALEGTLAVTTVVAGAVSVGAHAEAASLATTWAKECP
jgi:hypothetical protein